MTKDTKRRMYLALTTAAEYIRSIGEIGIEEDEYYLFGEDDFKGIEQFLKACKKSSEIIEKIANKYE